MFPPNNIRVPSDGNELFLISVIQKRLPQIKETMYVYGYQLSNTKMGAELMITETELKKWLDNKIFVEI